MLFFIVVSGGGHAVATLAELFGKLLGWRFRVSLDGKFQISYNLQLRLTGAQLQVALTLIRGFAENFIHMLQRVTVKPSEPFVGPECFM